jgi:S1-C subfamily serine protease
VQIYRYLFRAALLGLVLIAALPAARLAADTPPPAAAAPAAPPAPLAPPAAATNAQLESQLESQLEAARRQMEQAAREVARLSTQMSGSIIDQVMGGERAIIGVELEPAAGGAGARGREVSPGGPAAEAGIRRGDVLVAVNGTDLKPGEPTHQVVRIMHEVKADSRVKVRVLRDGQSREFVLTARRGPSLLAAIPDMADLAALPEMRGDFMFRRPLRDLELVTLTPRLGSYFGTDKGVLVVRAPGDGALQLEDGDVILAIDGREPTSGSHATRILGSYQPGEKITLRIVRQHKTLELPATLPQNNTPPLRREALRRDRALPGMPAVPAARPVIFGSGEA